MAVIVVACAIVFLNHQQKVNPGGEMIDGEVVKGRQLPTLLDDITATTVLG